MLGKVKRFNKVKGFCFMDGYKTISEGAPVEFDLVEGDRGLQAHNIKEIQEES